MPPNRVGPPPVENRNAVTVVGKYEEVVDQIGKRRDQFVALLGANNVDRWEAVALHALAQNKNVLKDCTPFSIIEAIRESAALGLSPTGMLGEGWILPYGDQAKFMPGYRGYLKLLRNSGQIRIADAQLVYMNDEFSVSLGTNPSIHHVPILYGEKNEEGTYIAERGDYRGAYAWVRLTSGENMIEWMTFDDLMHVKAKSRSKENGPWVTDPGEMMRKTPIRRLVKRLPLESMPLVSRAAVLDEEGDVYEGEAVEVTPASERRATAATLALARGQVDPADDQLGTPEKDSDTKPPEGTEHVGECGALSPYGDGAHCDLAAGHPTNHRGPDGSTWK